MAKTHLRRPSSPTHTLCGYGASRVRVVAEDPSCLLCLAKLYPADPRRAEMRALLEAVAKAWGKDPSDTLAGVLFRVSNSAGHRAFSQVDDTELLAALEKWKP